MKNPSLISSLNLTQMIRVVALTALTGGACAAEVTPTAGRLAAANFSTGIKVLRTPEGECWTMVATLGSGGLSNLSVQATSPAWPDPPRQDLGNIAAGHQAIEIQIPPLRSDQRLSLRFAWSEGERVFADLAMRPPRPWVVYLTQHTHTDIGYTRPQTEMLPESLRFIDYALDYCDATDGLPDDARFRWTCETLWAPFQYLKSRPPEQIERLRRRLRDGRVEITGLLLNLSEIATESALTAALGPVLECNAGFGTPVVTAMQNDVNGAAWCLADYFPDLGIQYLVMGINRTRSILPFDQPTVFWWESPAGKRVLAYRADHYHLGNFWRIHTGDLDFFGTELAQYLRSLEDRNYPFSRVGVQFSGYHTDNSPPSIIACDLVRRWNERYVWPRLRLSVAREFLDFVGREHRGDLAVHRQAWPDWWTDGFGSAARETAASREIHASMQVTDGLLALVTMMGRTLPEAVHARNANIQENLLFYDEHTFGAAESISDPLAENAQVQWAEKSAYVWTAVKEANLLREDAFGLLQDFLPRAPVPSLAVVNTLNWRRSGLARVFIDHELLPPDRECRLVDAASGRPVAAQPLQRRAEGTYWAVWVEDIPPWGYRMLRLESSANRRPAERPVPSDHLLENEFYVLTFDAERGAIMHLLDKETGRDLVDADASYGFGQLLYEWLTEGRDFEADRFRRATWRNLNARPGVDGPLWQSLIVSGDLEGCAPGSARAEIRLYKPEKRLELLFSIRKLPITRAEAVYVAFPFRPADGQIQYEAQGGVVVPGQTQLPGSASDWQTIQSFATVRHPRGQIVWTSPEAPLVQMGEINLGKWQPVTRVDRPHLYSWVMNNYWFTNFRISQEGDFRWSYSLTSHPELDLIEATRFGWNARIPLATRVLPASGDPTPGAGPAASWLSVNAPNVIVVDSRPARGHPGVIFHLREIAGREVRIFPEQVQSQASLVAADEVNAAGQVLQPEISEVHLAPYEVKFIRVTFEE